MKPRRESAWARWALLGGTATVAVFYGTTLRHTFIWSRSGILVNLGAGVAGVGRYAGSFQGLGLSGWSHWGYQNAGWWFDGEWSPSGVRLEAPLWAVLSPLALLTAFAWSPAGSDTGYCRVCRYDRAGLDDDTPCPECGAGV